MTPIFALYPPQPWYRGLIELAIVSVGILAIVFVCKRSKKDAPVWGRSGKTLSVIVIAIGGILAGAVRFSLATMPKWETTNFFYLWGDNVRWDWWTRDQICFSLLCVPLGMLASALLLDAAMRFVRRTPAP
jgi:hypothetical protein